MVITRRARSGSVKIVVICIVAAVAICVALIGGVVVKAAQAYAAEQEMLTTMMPFVEPYIARADEPSPGGDAHIDRKVIVVEVDEDLHEVDYFMYNRLGPLHAKAPAEAGTVIVCNYVWTEIGTYHEEGSDAISGRGYKCLCDVTVFDVADDTIVGRQLILGSDPIRSATSGGNHYGSNPNWDVLEYIQALPVR